MSPDEDTGDSTEIVEYTRSRDHFDNATEAWEDIKERSDRVESWDQWRESDHDHREFRFYVEVEG